MNAKEDAGQILMRQAGLEGLRAQRQQCFGVHVPPASSKKVIPSKIVSNKPNLELSMQIGIAVTGVQFLQDGIKNSDWPYSDIRKQTSVLFVLFTQNRLKIRANAKF